jgi:general secretion pathway protein G
MVLRRSHRAFTLIELLLVLVILAVLAAVVLPKFANRTKDANIAAAKAQISNFETALDLFETDTGRYPSTEEGLQALVVQPSGLQNWHDGYLKKGVPNDPWGNPYNYKYPGSHNSGYDLWSNGPSGRDGGEDNIVSWNDAK